jgi:hypothetical protein
VYERESVECMWKGVCVCVMMLEDRIGVGDCGWCVEPCRVELILCLSYESYVIEA